MKETYAKAPPVSILNGRSGWELMVIGHFSEQVPTPDPIGSAAIVIDNVKRRYPELWGAMRDTNLAPAAVADTLGWLRHAEYREMVR